MPTSYQSLADHGLTFGTTTAREVCLLLREPVPGIDPLGVIRHPGLTLTVANPERLAATVRHFAGLPAPHGRRARMSTLRRAQAVACMVTGGDRIRGGSLAPGLFAAGYGVRCVARQPADDQADRLLIVLGVPRHGTQIARLCAIRAGPRRYR